MGFSSMWTVIFLSHGERCDLFVFMTDRKIPTYSWCAFVNTKSKQNVPEVICSWDYRLGFSCLGNIIECVCVCVCVCGGGCFVFKRKIFYLWWWAKKLSSIKFEYWHWFPDLIPFLFLKSQIKVRSSLIWFWNKLSAVIYITFVFLL